MNSDEDGEHDLDKLARFIKRKLSEDWDDHLPSDDKDEDEVETEEHIPETESENQKVKENSKNKTIDKPTSTAINEEAAYRDHDIISKLILKLESDFDTKNLSKDKISQYQKILDKISSKYTYDDSIKGLYCVFYEMQALIYMTQQDNESSLKFIIEAAEIKPYNQDFISKAAQRWYSKIIETPSAHENPSTNLIHGHRKRHIKNKKVVFLITIFLLIIVGFAYGPISDYYTIKDANPAMVTLAQQAGMSRTGELLFLRAHPQLDSDTQFMNDCSTASANSNGTSLLGCYDPNTNRIYILQMPSSLYDEEVTTAAYEMLHPVYLNLSQSNSSNLNSAIEANFSNVSDDSSSCTDDIPGMVASFTKTEPGERDNELFSLLGTECNNLSPQLTAYYSPYFSNISIDVSDNQQVDDIFQNDENQLNQLNNTINQWNKTIATALYNTESWIGSGNQYEFNRNYNIYSQDIDDANNVINQYNTLLQQVNTLITAITGNQPINQIQNIQSQVNQ